MGSLSLLGDIPVQVFAVPWSRQRLGVGGGVWSAWTLVVRAVALQGAAVTGLEILAVLPGRGVGAQEGGCRLGVTRTYWVFICRAVHSVTLEFCCPFPCISHIPPLTYH